MKFREDAYLSSVPDFLFNLEICVTALPVYEPFLSGRSTDSRVWRVLLAIISGCFPPKTVAPKTVASTSLRNGYQQGAFLRFPNSSDCSLVISNSLQVVPCPCKTAGKTQLNDATKVRTSMIGTCCSCRPKSVAFLSMHMPPLLQLLWQKVLCLCPRRFETVPTRKANRTYELKYFTTCFGCERERP
jgi:hypothetical protein